MQLMEVNTREERIWSHARHLGEKFSLTFKVAVKPLLFDPGSGLTDRIQGAEFLCQKEIKLPEIDTDIEQNIYVMWGYNDGCTTYSYCSVP